jgi:peptidyl-prolyl cis-trans isomerase SurA
MKKYIFAILLAASFQAQAKLLDKIAGIIDDNIVTLSQIQRMGKSLTIKKNVAPMIYDKANYSHEEFLGMTVNRFLIRSKLNEIGFPVGDDQVEAQVKSNEKRLNVDREQLKSFLKTQNITYDEYFETLREAMEYSYFVSKIITPLISVSDQEVKNEFIKQNSKDSRLNVKYTLIDYAIGKESKDKINKEAFINAVKSYRLRSILDDEFQEMTTTNLEDITEEGLTSDLKALLKNTDEGSLSNVILINGQHHVFYIAKKDLVESENYTKQKEKIKDVLFEKSIKNEIAIWFEREKNKHYIKLSL